MKFTRLCAIGAQKSLHIFASAIPSNRFSFAILVAALRPLFTFVKSFFIPFVLLNLLCSDGGTPTTRFFHTLFTTNPAKSLFSTTFRSNFPELGTSEWAKRLEKCYETSERLKNSAQTNISSREKSIISSSKSLYRACVYGSNIIRATLRQVNETDT